MCFSELSGLKDVLERTRRSEMQCWKNMLYLENFVSILICTHPSVLKKWAFIHVYACSFVLGDSKPRKNFKRLMRTMVEVYKGAQWLILMPRSAEFTVFEKKFKNLIVILKFNSPSGNFNSVAINRLDFQTRNACKISKFQNCSKYFGDESNHTKSTIMNNFCSSPLPVFCFLFNILLIGLISIITLISKMLVGKQKTDKGLEQKLFRMVDLVWFDSSPKYFEQFWNFDIL